ncbi:MAG: hypothetical protein ACKPA9_02230, partial [Microcystis sp.]
NKQPNVFSSLYQQIRQHPFDSLSFISVTKTSLSWNSARTALTKEYLTGTTIVKDFLRSVVNISHNRSDS